MSVEIRVPPLGESVVEATVGQWAKAEGDAVARDEVLVELETDKITVEVAAQQAGVLGKIEKQEGETVGVDDLLGLLEAGEGAATAPSDAGAAEPAAAAETPPAAAPAAAGEDDGKTSPAVRAIAAENDLDLSTVKGTGPDGRITKEDALAAVRAKGEPAAAPAPKPAAAPPPPRAARPRSA